MAKYTLTNKWIEITEKEGALPNNSVLYPILLAASTTWPDINTSYKAVPSGETQNLKAAENEKMYLRFFTNDNDAQFEVSVVTFIPEQIQNLSKTHITSTIPAQETEDITSIFSFLENGDFCEVTFRPSITGSNAMSRYLVSRDSNGNLDVSQILIDGMLPGGTLSWDTDTLYLKNRHTTVSYAFRIFIMKYNF